MRDLLRYAKTHSFSVSYCFSPITMTWTVTTGGRSEDETITPACQRLYTACEEAVANIRDARAKAGNPIPMGEDGAEDPDDG